MRRPPPSLAELRTIRLLLKQPGWFEDLPDNVRKGLLAKLLQLAQKADARPRELIGVAKVLVAMEKNDLERCRQLMQVEIDVEDDDAPKRSRSRA